MIITTCFHLLPVYIIVIPFQCQYRRARNALQLMENAITTPQLCVGVKKFALPHCTTTESSRYIREGVKKNRLFLGKSRKQRTPPTHRYSLGLT